MSLETGGTEQVSPSEYQSKIAILTSENENLTSRLTMASEALASGIKFCDERGAADEEVKPIFDDLKGILQFIKDLADGKDIDEVIRDHTEK